MNTMLKIKLNFWYNTFNFDVIRNNIRYTIIQMLASDNTNKVIYSRK